MMGSSLLGVEFAPELGQDMTSTTIGDFTQILTSPWACKRLVSSMSSTWICPYRPTGWTTMSRPSVAASTYVLSAVRP